jgi:uncharacterized protein YdhG (YjbR/CyaY superfamily)
MTDVQKRTRGASATDESRTWTDEERDAMKERARELKAQSRKGGKKVDGEQDLLAKIAEMPAGDRAIAERIHAVVRASAPDLEPKTWYGMPAYARDGKVVCFFKNAGKFGARYGTFGFEDAARLDDGRMWPTSYAITEMTADVEERIAELVKRAAR